MYNYSAFCRAAIGRVAVANVKCRLTDAKRRLTFVRRRLICITHVRNESGIAFYLFTFLPFHFFKFFYQ